MPAEAETGRILLLNRAADVAPAEVALDPALLADNLIFGFEQMGAGAYPFFSMRSQLLKIVNDSEARILAITSAQPGNGKTHVAVNLAAALSHIHPTILIELDLRRPSIGSRLGMPAWLPGIDDFLSGDVGFLESSIRIKGFNLCIHRVRRMDNQAEQLLAAPSLKSLIDGIRAADGRPICIIDTPPTIIQDDLSRIANVVDGVLLVVEEGVTSTALAKEAEAMLTPTPVVGTILNKSLSSARARSSYDHDYYYYAPSN